MLSYKRLSTKNKYDGALATKGYVVYRGESELVIAHLMVTCSWSPCIWKDGYRLGANFIQSHYCALDFENPQVSLDSIYKRFRSHWHVLGTTRNHQRAKYEGQANEQAPCDRFRLLLKWSSPIVEAEKYEYNALKMAKDLGADTKCRDAAHFFFPCDKIISMSGGDVRLAVAPVPQGTTRQERREAAEARTVHHNSYGRESSFIRRWLRNVIPTGQRNDTCFVLGCEMRRAGWDLDDAVEAVLTSPTFRGIVPEPPKVRDTVTRGWRDAARELTSRVETQKPS